MTPPPVVILAFRGRKQNLMWPAPGIGGAVLDCLSVVF